MCLKCQRLVYTCTSSDVACLSLTRASQSKDPTAVRVILSLRAVDIYIVLTLIMRLVILLGCLSVVVVGRTAAFVAPLSSASSSSAISLVERAASAVAPAASPVVSRDCAARGCRRCVGCSSTGAMRYSGIHANALYMSIVCTGNEARW